MHASLTKKEKQNYDVKKVIEKMFLNDLNKLDTK